MYNWSSKLVPYISTVYDCMIVWLFIGRVSVSPMQTSKRCRPKWFDLSHAVSCCTFLSIHALLHKGVWRSWVQQVAIEVLLNWKYQNMCSSISGYFENQIGKIGKLLCKLQALSAIVGFTGIGTHWRASMNMIDASPAMFPKELEAIGRFSYTTQKGTSC